jgi:hypothetical protein
MRSDEARVIERRRTGDDAVEVGREALRLHQRHATAVGAAGEVRVRLRPAVVRLQKSLRHARGLGHGAPRPVRLGDTIVLRPATVRYRAAPVTAVHGYCRVAALEPVIHRIGESRALDVEPPAESVAPHHVELAVPVLDRQPKLEVDRRDDHSAHPAVRRQFVARLDGDAGQDLRGIDRSGQQHVARSGCHHQARQRQDHGGQRSGERGGGCWIHAGDAILIGYPVDAGGVNVVCVSIAGSLYRRRVDRPCGAAIVRSCQSRDGGRGRGDFTRRSHRRRSRGCSGTTGVQ